VANEVVKAAVPYSAQLLRQAGAAVAPETEVKALADQVDQVVAVVV
jgi:hypothetical protein